MGGINAVPLNAELAHRRRPSDTPAAFLFPETWRTD